MRIIVDIFGGDNAPLSTLKGSARAVKELGVEVLAVGDIPTMEKCCADNNIDTTGIVFKQADKVFGMEDDPQDIIKKRTDTSMHIALKALADGQGDALVSAGSTGALLMGATFIVKRIKGCRRPALGGVLPGKNPGGFMLIDSGANAEVRPEMLAQFALMGSVYMGKVAGRQNPRVALLNNGTEPTKGTETHRRAYRLMEAREDINFIGNIEGRDVMDDIADVVVADGFSGNIALKVSEGVANFMNQGIKDILKTNLRTKIAALLIKNELKQFKAKLDYTEYGGVPVLGVRAGVIKAHGSSDRKAVKNAIRQAKIYAENDVSALIARRLGREEDQ